MTAAAPRRRGLAGRRLVLAGAAGLVAGVGVGIPFGFEYGPVTVWLVASALYLTWTWLAIWPMDAALTARRATREDPTVGAAHLVLLVATGPRESLLAAALGVLSVALSWVTVHTVYTLGYAAMYYAGEDGGIDFNQQQPPAYADFAYVGFTLGMTYQVSDTTVSDPGIRRMVLRHTLLSYVLGAVVLAIAINLVGNLAG